jgi:hypothetical protein
MKYWEKKRKEKKKKKKGSTKFVSFAYAFEIFDCGFQEIGFQTRPFWKLVELRL